MFTDLIGETKYINTDNAQSLILNIRNKYSDLRREMDAYREIRDTKNQVVNPNAFKYTGDEWYKINQEATRKYYQNYTADQRAYYDELLRLQDRMNDETFSSFQDLFDRINDLNDKAGTWEKDRTGARDTISDAISGSTSSTKNNAEKIFDENSIAYLQKNIQKLQTEFEQAGNDGLRAGLNKAIKEAETQLQMLKLRAEKQELISDNTFSNKNKFRNPTDDINSGKLPKLNIANNDQLTDTIELTDLLGESLYFVGDALGGLNGLLDESSSKWVQYGATLAASITKSIPLIIAATKATQAKAIAEGASSAAQTPLVGWINAIAAISAMMAAFASMPIYATGGIVGGSSFVGDNMLIRANSGEMILNKKQQANLFNLLDGGYMAKSLSSGNVEFRIQGKELVGVLTAYNNKVSKYI